MIIFIPPAGGAAVPHVSNVLIGDGTGGISDSGQSVIDPASPPAWGGTAAAGVNATTLTASTSIVLGTDCTITRSAPGEYAFGYLSARDGSMTGGSASFTDFLADATGSFHWVARSRVTSTSDGSVSLFKNDGTTPSDMTCGSIVLGTDQSVSGDNSLTLKVDDNFSMKLRDGGANTNRLRSYGNFEFFAGGVVADQVMAASMSSSGLFAPLGLTVGGGAAIKKVLSATASLDFGTIAAGDTHSLTMTVTGAAAGDPSFPGVNNAGNLEFSATATASDTVTIFARNFGGGDVTPGSQAVFATVFKF